MSFQYFDYMQQGVFRSLLLVKSLLIRITGMIVWENNRLVFGTSSTSRINIPLCRVCTLHNAYCSNLYLVKWYLIRFKAQYDGFHILVDSILFWDQLLTRHKKYLDSRRKSKSFCWTRWAELGPYTYLRCYIIDIL